jgi:hypothetical protein
VYHAGRYAERQMEVAVGLRQWLGRLWPFRRRGPTGAGFSDERYWQHYEAKKAALERILGPMDEVVGHAIIPFAVGGGVDVYYFSQAMPGTVFVTMELIEPDGTGPRPNRLGTYELVASTRLPAAPPEARIARRGDDAHEQDPFDLQERRAWGVLTALGRYSFEAVLEPGDTAEAPGGEGEPNRWVLLDEFETGGVPFEVEGRRHGLLLCMEVHPCEVEYAREHGSGELLEKLKQAGAYPYSDLDRPPVV